MYSRAPGWTRPLEPGAHLPRPYGMAKIARWMMPTGRVCRGRRLRIEVSARRAVTSRTHHHRSLVARPGLRRDEPGDSRRPFPLLAACKTLGGLKPAASAGV